MTSVEVTRAMARTDAAVNTEVPLGAVAVDDWYLDAAARSAGLGVADPADGTVDPRDVVAAIDDLGRHRASDVYDEEWLLILAERSGVA